MADQTTVTVDDFVVTSNHATEAEIRDVFEAPSPAADEAATAGTSAAPADAAGSVTAGEERNSDGTFKAKAGKPRHDPHARIAAATAKEAQAKRERDDIIAERDSLRAELAAAKLQSTPAEHYRAPADSHPHLALGSGPDHGADPEPDPADATKYAEGQFDRQYLKDQARWEARQEFREQAQVQAQHAQAARAEAGKHQLATTFQQKLRTIVETGTSAVENEHPVARVVRWAQEQQIRPELISSKPLMNLQPGEPANVFNAIAQVVVESSDPESLMRHLSTHPDDLQRLSTLPPDAFFRMIGRIEQRLEAAARPGPVSREPVISRAKPLIKPVSGSPVVSDDGDEADLPVDEFIRRGNLRDSASTRRH